MKKVKLITLCILLLVPFYIQSRNDIFKPGQVWNDTSMSPINAHGGGIMCYEGRYYWFGEHKSDTTNNAYDGVRCYSSDNLYDWKNEGLVFNVIHSDPTHDVTAGCILERPKVIYNAKTKKFVMWFHLELKDRGYGTARYGVAISDNVVGPYRFVYSSRANANTYPKNISKSQINKLNDSAKMNMLFKENRKKAIEEGYFFARNYEGGQMARDMTLYVDDDGKAYHIYSSEENTTLHIAQLTDDYLFHNDNYVRVLPGGNNEAPAIFKHKGKYWMISSDCTYWNPNQARLSVSDNIMGEWKKVGDP
ncbi:MAG: glycoside hydrolase family 43 protein, partial [Muribaculaceae bacterium]